MSNSGSPAARTRAGGRNGLLDALRGLAVAAVVAFHIWPHAVPGGFLGVDVFFVLSGYLITGPLLAGLDTGEVRQTLQRFWIRRSRRILPALLVVAATSTAAAGLLGGSPSTRIRPQVLAAATFSSNWYFASAHQSYFDEFDKPLFQHLWSLAVEEQFYLVWPVVLLLLGRTVRSRRAQAGVITALALGSAAVMALGFAPGHDPSRLYFGTDSHGFSLLVGAATALVASRVAKLASGHRAVFVASASVLALILGLASVGTAFATMPATGAFAYRGGILLVDVAVAGLVLVLEQMALGRIATSYAVGQWSWLGVRSYGIYLWHWPVIVLLRSRFAPDTTWEQTVLAATVLAFSVGLADATWRLVEKPVISLGWHGALVALGRQSSRCRWTRLAAVGATAVAMGAAVTVVRSADRTDAESYVDSGLQLVQSLPSDVPEPGPQPPRDHPVHPPPRHAPGVVGANITVIGDSVTLASARGLIDRFPAISINAAVGFQFWNAPKLVRSLEADHLLRPYVVVALGTNGQPSEETLLQIIREAGSGHWFVFVNAHGDRPWIGTANRVLEEFAKSHPRVGLADWNGAATRVPDFASDGIHPGPRGGKVFADVVATALDRERAGTAGRGKVRR